jgi:hypothetical protein
MAVHENDVVALPAGEVPQRRVEDTIIAGSEVRLQSGGRRDDYAAERFMERRTAKGIP